MLNCFGQNLAWLCCHKQLYDAVAQIYFKDSASKLQDAGHDYVSGGVSLKVEALMRQVGWKEERTKAELQQSCWVDMKQRRLLRS